MVPTKFWISYNFAWRDPAVGHDYKITSEQIPDNATILRTITDFNLRASISDTTDPQQQWPLLMGALIRPFDVDGDSGWPKLFDGSSDLYIFWACSSFLVNTEKNALLGTDQHFYGPKDTHYRDVASRRILPPKPCSIFFSACTQVVSYDGSGDMLQLEFTGTVGVRILYEVPD